jgi:hypothetical protein
MVPDLSMDAVPGAINLASRADPSQWFDGAKNTSG